MHPRVEAFRATDLTDEYTREQTLSRSFIMYRTPYGFDLGGFIEAWKAAYVWVVFRMAFKICVCAFFLLERVYNTRHIMDEKRKNSSCPGSGCPLPGSCHHLHDGVLHLLSHRLRLRTMSKDNPGPAIFVLFFIQK